MTFMYAQLLDGMQMTCCFSRKYVQGVSRAYYILATQSMDLAQKDLV